MKIDFKNVLKKEWWIGVMRRTRGWFLGLPKWLFIRHGHTFNVVVVVLIMMFSFLLIARALYFEPKTVSVEQVLKTSLSTSSIDQIIIWIGIWATINYTRLIQN